ncbi:MAG: LysR family transcriptional regulator [Lachnospiraceae bacterium]|nr:LysR family transcriptional regulator [Lachnospiraceae bacterium]
MEYLEMREIEYILTLAEEKSVSRAAERCFISQPQFSKIILRAEKKMGLRIFDRKTHPLSVSPEGELLLPHLRKLQEAYRDFVRSCAAFQKDKRADLTIAAPSFFCTHSLPPLVRAFEGTYPDRRIRLMESNDTDLKILLDSGTADLGITVQQSLTELFPSEILEEETLVLAVPASFAVNRGLEKWALSLRQIGESLPEMPALPEEELARFADTDFLFLKSGNDLRERGLKLCRKAGFSPRITMELDQLMTAYYLAEAGLGATFTRAGAPRYSGGNQNLLFYQLEDPLMRRSVYLLHGKERGDFPAREFIRFLRDWNPAEQEA